MTTADLIYDSARSGLAIGLRSPALGKRSLVFETPRVMVDLVLQQDRGDWGFVHGQVIGTADGDAIAGADASLGDDENRAPTDDCGLFSLRLGPERASQTVRVRLQDGESVECVIPPPIDPDLA